MEEHELRALFGQISRLEAQVIQLRKEVDNLESRQTAIYEQMLRWRSALPIFLALGAVVAWLLTQWPLLQKLLQGAILSGTP